MLTRLIDERVVSNPLVYKRLPLLGVPHTGGTRSTQGGRDGGLGVSSKEIL
jgi:hypothetical protein